MEETAGKEDPVELDSSLPLLNILGGVEYLGGSADDEIPELSMLFYLSRHAEPCRPRPRAGARPVLESSVRPVLRGARRQRGRHRQVGSLAGAAHMLNDNTSVLKRAHLGQKPRVEQKGKSLPDFGVQYAHKP